MYSNILLIWQKKMDYYWSYKFNVEKILSKKDECKVVQSIKKYIFRSPFKIKIIYKITIKYNTFT